MMCAQCGVKPVGLWRKRYCGRACYMAAASVRKRKPPLERECHGCGVRFLATNSQRIRCTPTCGREINRKLHRGTCRACGVDVISHRPTARYCSRACANRAIAAVRSQPRLSMRHAVAPGPEARI